MTQSETKTADRVPSGFRPLALTDGFIGHNGPVYIDRTGAEPVFGFSIRDTHCNPMAICHGGWVATMMDMVLPLTARFSVPDLADHFLLTVNMAVDYLGSARLGAWVEGRGQVLKRTGRMVFTQGLLTVDGEPIARASGIFRIGPTAPPIDELGG
ncbi:PaaI family thioesterase [Sphingomonas paeninsulae]|uniref:PaaI family thioesterase n=1 Tax=Sphingomonas paeninsulae TaxID=2319844 RepID=UPI0013CE4D98|nr:PaaI family thioesterase [Sphingomonas paeninsulae]